MMPNQLKKHWDSERKDKTIFDIIWFGSSAKGEVKPNDLDIVVIFLEGTLRERLDKISSIKEKLKSTGYKKIDVKQILLQDLFSSDFLARTGILLEGVSLFKQRKLCEVLGFESFALFWYNLNGLSHNQKVKFNYILAVRNEMQGVIKSLEGRRLVNGAVMIPIKNTLTFEGILKQNNINYKKEYVLTTSV